MRPVVGFVAMMSMFGVTPMAANGGPARTVYVNCASQPGGDGSARAPFASITAALPAARALSAQYRVTVDVAAGVCDHEAFPIRLDFPVRLQGARLPRFDQGGFPLGDQLRDTVVTWTPPAVIPAGLSFFEVTGDDVELSRLSLDGQIPPGPNVSVPPVLVPIGVFLRGAGHAAVDQLRIVQMGTGVRAEGATASFTANYVGVSNSGFVLFGAALATTPMVVCTNNRIEDYRVNGIALAGIAATATATTGAISALIAHNDVVTTYSTTGPSNPAALRVSPSTGDATDGDVNAAFLFNQVRGTPAYAIAVHGGQPRRRPDHRHYTGSMTLAFYGTQFDAAAQHAQSVITFTNVRAEALPCELNPANDRTTCPSLGTPPVYWEFLEQAGFELWHGGELDGATIDHPVVDPFDGRILGNLLRINGAIVNPLTPPSNALDVWRQ